MVLSAHDWQLVGAGVCVFFKCLYWLRSAANKKVKIISKGCIKGSLISLITQKIAEFLDNPDVCV